MAEILTPITNFANTPFLTVVAAVNAIIGLIGGDVVTANGSANGSLTVGNCYVSGISGASIMTPGSLRGGNVQASATLPVTSNLFLTNSSFFSIGNSSANAVISQNNITIPTGNFATATVGYFPQSNLTFANSSYTEVDMVVGIGATLIDSFPLASYRTAEYIIQVTDNAANNYQATKLFVVHDGVTPVSTEYAQLVTNTAVATFNVSANATNFLLTVTSGSTNLTVRSLRTTLNS